MIVGSLGTRQYRVPDRQPAIAEDFAARTSSYYCADDTVSSSSSACME